MIKSMTGFGKSLIELPNKSITIEIKSLNSKQLDINTRMPGIYREKDMNIRNLLARRLQRGKIDLFMQMELIGDAGSFNLNQELAMKYYHQLKGLSESIDQDTDTDFISILARMPDVFKAAKEELDESEWEQIMNGIIEAVDGIDQFRSGEGKELEQDMRQRISLIQEYLLAIEPYEKKRIETVRNKLENNLAQFYSEAYDQNRFEQELIYYLEKLDVTEEKVRLKRHCEYFTETLEQPESQGKKLAFITQEVGREINTIGSKANDADIQKIIVQMKDELEKIKEQLMNIL